MPNNKNKQLPVDFSKAAISRHVLRDVSSHPSVVYLIAAGLLGGVSMLAFGPTLIAGAAAVIGTAGAATSWLVNYKLRDEHFARAHVAQMTERLEQQRKETMRQIGHDLEKLGMREAYSQYTRVSDKYALYKKTLSNNLHAGELTYSRYLGTGEQVYLSILDNLKALIHAKKSADGIDETYIRQRIKSLQDHNDHHAQE
jgi:hypothetical protein